MSKETENPLATFILDTPGVPKTETNESKVDKPTKVKTSKKKEDTESQESLIDEKNTSSFFTDKVTQTPGDPLEDESEDSDEELESEDGEEIEDNNPSSIRAIIDHYKEKGVLDVPENFDSEFKDSDEDLDKVIDYTATKRADKKFESRIKKLPEYGQKFLEFMENDGDPKQFAEMYFLDHSYEDISPELLEKDVDAQKFIIGSYLKQLDPTNTDEEIEAEIKELEDMGALESKAKKYHPKLIEKEKLQKNELVERQKIEKQAKDKQVKEYWEGVKKDLFDRKDLKGFSIDNKTLKEGLYDYMTKPVKDGKSQMQIDTESSNQVEDQLLWAYLKYTKYDINKLSKSIKTKVTKELKSKLNNWSDNRNKFNQANTEGGSDYGDLGAFILKTEK